MPRAARTATLFAFMALRAELFGTAPPQTPAGPWAYGSLRPALYVVGGGSIWPGSANGFPPWPAVGTILARADDGRRDTELRGPSEPVPVPPPPRRGRLRGRL